jgi:hypothetical protein
MEDFYDIGFSNALQLEKNNRLYENNSDYTDGYNDGIESSVVVAKEHSEEDEPSVKGLYVDYPSYKRTYRKALKNRGLNMREYEKGYKDGSLSRAEEYHDVDYLLGYKDGYYQFNQAYTEGNTGYTLSKGHSNEFIKVYNEGRRDSSSSARGKSKKRKNKKNRKYKTKRK